RRRLPWPRRAPECRGGRHRARLARGAWIDARGSWPPAEGAAIIQDAMFRIREFSRFSRVSVKMLRHYDRLGLLHPARVDPDTRYRYYSARQLPRLNRILALRDLGFSL